MRVLNKNVNLPHSMFEGYHLQVAAEALFER